MATRPPLAELILTELILTGLILTGLILTGLILVRLILAGLPWRELIAAGLSVAPLGSVRVERGEYVSSDVYPVDF